MKIVSGPSDLRSRERWVAWMQSDHAIFAAFVASFLEMTVIPIPVEAALTPAMIAAPRRRWALALAALAGSVTCAVAWYFLAQWIGDDVASWIGGEDELRSLEQAVRDRGFGYVFLAGVTPIPFQLACVAAGAVNMAFGSFLLASVLARGLRYFGLAGLVAALGETARRWLLERKWALVLLMVAVGGALFGIGSALRALLGE